MIEKLVELQKALDQWETQVNAMTLSWGSIQVQQANFHYFKELFSAFQKDYDSKVPVDLQKQAKTTGQLASEMGRKYQNADKCEAFEFQNKKWVSLDVLQQYHLVPIDQWESFKQNCIVRDKTEYEKEIHIDRKQLSEIYSDFIAGGRDESIKERLFRLLSGSVEAHESSSPSKRLIRTCCPNTWKKLHPDSTGAHEK